MQTNLTRHMKAVHKDEKLLQDLAELSYDERNRYFADLRKKGILKHNKSQMKRAEPKYVKERDQSSKSKLVMCSKCRDRKSVV